ncbi:MAG: 2-hydroxyacyl-CoA dehydratase family protein [Nitrospirota bacterium]
MPIELILTAGLSPSRILGGPVKASYNNTYLPQNFCSFSRNCFSLMISGMYDFLDGVIFTNADQAMERLYDCWRKKMKTQFVYMLDVPKNRNNTAINYYRNRLEVLSQVLCRKFSGESPDLMKLRQCIRYMNEVRKEIKALYITKPQQLSFSQIHNTIKNLLEGPFKIPILNMEITSRINCNNISNNDKRIIVIGSMLENSELLQYIEERISVVKEDLCTGWRFCEIEVDLDISDPYLAVARAYLLRTPCPRMHCFSERSNYIEALIDRLFIDGIIYFASQFRVPDSYEAVMIREEICRKRGIKFLLIEREHGKAPSAAELNRVDAFLETL